MPWAEPVPRKGQILPCGLDCRDLCPRGNCVHVSLLNFCGGRAFLSRDRSRVKLRWHRLKMTEVRYGTLRLKPADTVKDSFICPHCRDVLLDAVQNEDGDRLCHKCCNAIAG